MCFSACSSNAQDDRWFNAALENDVEYLAQNKKRRITSRDIRFTQDNVYPGFTAFLYAVYHNNVDAMAVLLPDELTLPSLEPVVFEEDQKYGQKRPPGENSVVQTEGILRNTTDNEGEHIANVVENDDKAKTDDAAKNTREESKRMFRRRPEDTGPEYNYREFPGNSTSLDLAVHCGSWDAFNLMIESIKFQPDEFNSLMYCKNEHRECLLHFFVRNGSTRALYELMETGRQFIVRNLDCESDLGVNPVVLSIRMGKINFLEYFLSLGYDDECFEKLNFCLRKQKNKPAVEDLCTPSQMFNTTEEDAYQAAFLLAAFRGRSLPPAPQWLLHEMEEKIRLMQEKEVEKLEQNKEKGPIPPWLKKQREAGIVSSALSNDAVAVPQYGIALDKFSENEQNGENSEKDGLLHVYDELVLPEEAKVEIYTGECPLDPNDKAGLVETEEVDYEVYKKGTLDQ